jgi:di/tricarboxylate transporter
MAATPLAVLCPATLSDLVARCAVLCCAARPPPRSAMFITAMAANPLAVNLAAAEGINISWGLWALAGLAPGLICLATVPLILYALYPPGMAQHQVC